MNIQFKLILVAAIVFFAGPAAVFSATAVGRCAPARLAITLNQPLPETVFSPGDEITFDGRIWYPGSLLNSGKCAKIAFFVATDSDIGLSDCLGQPAGGCEKAPVLCAVPSICGIAVSSDTKTAVENPAGVFKIGELEIADSAQTINSGDYGAQFHQVFKLPQNPVLQGRVRFYVQYTGVVAGINGERTSEWLTVYQKGTINDSLPVKIVSVVSGGNAVQTDYCTSSSGPAAILYWKWSDTTGSPQVAYQVQIGDQADFSRIIHDSGKIKSGSANYATPAGKFEWKKRYYWRVKAWSQAGVVSNWSSGDPFSVPLHPYPKVSFTWAPKISVELDAIDFIDESEVYGNATKARWLWLFEGGEPAVSYEKTGRTFFPVQGAKNIRLSVSDSDGYTCEAARLLKIGPKP